MQTFISFLAKSSLYRELFAIFAAKINDYEDIKVQIAERFCKETLITEISQVSPKRPERAEAPSPGQRPGLLWTQTCRPVIIPRAMPWARSFWAFSPFLNHLRNLSQKYITMTIKDEKTYNEIEERMEALLAKGTQLGGMDFLSEVEKEELKVLSEAAYDWECEVDPHPWRVKPSLIAAIKVAFRQKGYKQKEAAKAIGVSTTALSDILHGRRAINFDVARNIYHNLGVPANVVLG